MKNKQVCCEWGHYYNESLGSCPICNQPESSSTVLVDVAGGGEAPKKRVILDDSGKTKMIKPLNDGKTMYMSSNVDSSKKTISKKEEKNDDEAVLLAGWLVITSENGRGKDFHVTYGFNSIGRNESNHIYIDNEDNSISREKHASIIYDYANNTYFLKHEDGKFLTYLNNEVVLEIKELSSYDTVKVGNTELLFIALCNDSFKWDS